MSTLLKNLLSLTALVFFLLLAIASNSVKNTSITADGGQIPPEFSTFKDTLLVISHPEDWGYDHYLKKNFRDNYTGHYKIIKDKELDSYPAEQYRYVFNNSLSYETNRKYVYSTTPTSATFGITDRKLQKGYSTEGSAQYSKLMRAYIKALEENRKKAM